MPDVIRFRTRRAKLLTPKLAKAALLHDKLGTAYHRANEVVVITAHGSGVFSRELWDLDTESERLSRMSGKR